MIKGLEGIITSKELIFRLQGLKRREKSESDFLEEDVGKPV